MKTKKEQATNTPWKFNGYQIVDKNDNAVETKENRGRIIRAVNSHEALLEAAKNARNVLAALAMGHLDKVRSDSPALLALRDAIAQAEGGK